MAQDGGEEAFLLLLLLLDEDVFGEEGFEGYSFAGFPGEELFYECVDVLVFYVLVYYLVYFWLVHVFYSYGGAGEEPEPDLTDVPHELVLGRLVIFVLLGVVAVVSFLYLLASLADGMA